MRLGRFRRLGVASIAFIAAVSGLVTATAEVSAAVAVKAVPAAAALKPVVGRLSPASGPTAGGWRVTVTGQHFTKVTRVDFGSSAGRSLKVLSGTELVVTTPEHAPGRVDVRVVTASGTSAVAAAGRFSYIAPPAITKVSPAQGPTKGGSQVTITGSSFIRVTKVTFGGVKATIDKSLSPTVLLVTAPAGTAGQVDIRVSTAYGISASAAAGHFRYIAPKEALTWTGPHRVDGDGVGDLDSAGCLTPTDCFAIDAAGKMTTWNGST
jgi:hypothetical protein